MEYGEDYDPLRRDPLENEVDLFYGLDKTEYTNAVYADDLEISEEIVVFEFYGYNNPPQTPCSGKVISWDGALLDVEVNGKQYEVVEGCFGKKLN